MRLSTPAQSASKPKGNGWFAWLLLVLLLTLAAFTLLISGTPKVKESNGSSPRVQPSVVKADEACDITAQNYKPEFAPRGWKIYCVDKIPPQKLKGRGPTSIIYGITFANKDDQIIEISRGTPVDLLRHVIVHEWVHAYVTDKGLHGSQRWEEWKKYLEDEGNILSDNYEQNADEILADNVALATVGGVNTVNGVMKLKPEDVWKIFPELKPRAQPGE